MSSTTGASRAERVFAAPGIAPADLTASIADDLIAVEDSFRTHLAAPVSIVDEIGSFVAESGGKRVRPILHLLTAKACAYRGPHAVLLATVLEFIHTATLIHDDIIDGATRRRGRPSPNSVWGNNVTVLFGDYLFAKAMELALRAGRLEVMEKLADVTLRMTEGEMLQTRYVGRTDLTVAEYLDLVERKTAALFGCCCDLAALLAGVDDERRESLRQYGLKLGMGFQLVDDLLDFTGDAAILGKPAGSDLREGKATLAVIDLLEREPATARPLVEAVMRGGDDDAGVDAALDDLTVLLRASGSLDRSHERARAYAAGARAELEQLDDSAALRALRSLPDLLLFRDR